MATTIDQKVVEMKFDNRDFERNTKQTMSTLDKLKNKLKFNGASKGLEELGKSTKKVDMNGLAAGISTVQAKFSAMEVMGVTALANITNSAVNAGKQMVKALTVEPVSDGFNEYEMTLNAIQTTMAGTGKTAKDVKDQLKLLDEYADKTVYSTSDMLNNLPKFTNAGVELETATTAMIGIANATALAGGDASKASIAFYNLGQAIGTGYLTRMDYNSINNAGIATMEWKQQMVDAAIAAGTLEEVEDGLYKAGNRVMTLQQLFIDGLQEQWATTDVMIKVFKDYGDETTAIGKRAYAAAQDIKTYSMMMDSLKATAGTGWKDTWEIIFGDLDQAKEMWTGLTNFIGTIINSVANLRNQFLGNAFNFDGFQSIMDKINNNSVVKTMNSINEKVQATTKSLSEYQDVISRVWRGDYNNVGDNPDRFDLLRKEGWNPEVVQDLVNKTEEMAGYGKGWTAIGQLTIDDVRKSEEKYGLSVTETTKAVGKQTETAKDLENQLENLSEEKLRELGLDEDEIKMYQDLQKASKKYGLSIDELLAKMKKSTGRDLLFGKKKRNEDGTIATDESGAELYETVGVAQNIASALINIFGSIKDAWTETFDGLSSVDLYMIFENINKFSLSIKKATENEKGMRNLTDTFKGLFAILKLTSTLLGGGIKIAWTIFKTILQTCGMSVLDFTGAVGNMISSLVNFITENNLVIDGIVWLTKLVAGGIVSIYKWAASFISINDAIHIFQNGLNNFKSDFSTWIKNLKEADDIPKYIIDGLVNGLKKYGGKAWDAITSFITTFISKARKTLGIESPSKEFFEIGKYIILGLFNGIKTFVTLVYDLVKTMGMKIIEIVKDLDFGSLFVIIASASAIFTFYKLAKTFSEALTIIAKGIQSLNSVISNFSRIEIAFADLLKAAKLKIMSESLKGVAVAIAILVGSIYVLGKMDVGTVWASIGAIAVLVALLGTLVAVSGYFGKGEALQFGKLALTILAIGIAMSLMAKALKKVAEIDDASWAAIIAFGVMIVAFMGIIKLLSQNNWGENGSPAKMLLAMGVAFYLMGATVKKLGKMDPNELKQGRRTLELFTGLIVALIASTRLIGGKAKSIEVIGKALISIGVTFYLMAMTVKKLGKMDPNELKQGRRTLELFTGLIVALMLSTRLLGKNSKNIQSIGKTLILISGAILLMALTVKILGGMELDKLKKGIASVAAFEVMIIGLIYAFKKIGGTDCKNLGATIMEIAIAIGIMSLVCVLLSILKEESLAKGLIAVGLLSKFMEGLIKATSGSHIVSSKTMWSLVGAIGVLGLVVAGLSLIKPERLIAPTIAMSLLMGIFSLMIKSAKQLDGGKELKSNLLLMMGVVALLTAVVAGLSFLNGENAIAGAGAVALIAGSLVGMLHALNKLGKIDSKTITKQLIAMVGILGVLFIATLVLRQMHGINNIAEAVVGLVVLISGLTLVMFALSKMGSQATNALIGVVGLLGLMVVLAAAVGVLSIMSGVKNAAQNAIILTGFITALTLVLLLTAAVGAIYAATGFIAATGLVGLLAVIGLVALLIPILKGMNSVQNAQTNCNLLIGLMTVMTDMLFKISLVGPLALMAVTALGALMIMMPIMIGFAVLLGALMSYIPQLKGFINTGLPIMVQVAGAMGEMIGAFVSGALTQASNALPTIGKNLSLFMLNSTPFIVGMKMVNGQVLKGTGIMAGSILALTTAQLINGIVSFLSLGSNISDLGTELSRFAINAMPFITAMSVIPASAMNGVKSLSGAILALTAANLLEGISRFFGGGGSSLSAFGNELPPLGKAMAGFVNNLGEFTEAQVTTTDCAGRAISALAEAAKSLPKSGGWVQKIFGEGSLADFADNMPKVAKGVVDFVKTLGTFSQPQIDAANCACEVIKSVAKAAKAVSSEGGFWQKLFGSKNDGLAKFADNMPKVGEGVKGFIEKLEPVKNKSDVANAGSNIISSIAKISDLNLKKTNENLPKFGDTMNKYGDKLKTFIDKLKGFTKEDVETANNNLILITTAVKNMMDTVNKGITDKSDDVTQNMASVAKTAAEGISSNDVINTVKVKGKDFVQGFANGINENKDIAYNAAYLVGQRANEGVSNAIDSHSPSKEAMYRGEYFGEGFVIGIQEYSSKVYKVGENVGDEARKGLTSAISKISNLVESGIDGNPTIRPVLDLSEVTEGANSINSMFSNPNLQLMSNLNSISSGMHERNQNGNNSDVVSAINKLGKNLNENTGNTYNINGITYSDNNNINNAVMELIKAIEIEGRV